MRFLVDAQLPPALAVLLDELGHIAEHITDIGPADTPDRELWRYALEFRAVIVTKDEDFAHMIATGVDAPHVSTVFGKGGAAAGLAIGGPIGAGVGGFVGGVGGALFGGWAGGRAAEEVWDFSYQRIS